MSSSSGRGEFSPERWHAFWERKAVDRPLLGAALEMPDAGAIVDPLDRPVQPRDLDLPGYLALCDEMAGKAANVPGASVWAASPFQGFPWMEAILGCEVHSAGGSLWAEPVKGVPDEQIASWRSSPWLEVLLEFAEALAAHANGRYHVGAPVLRGPADILAALRTSASFCLDCYEAPTQLTAWLAGCTAAYVEVLQRLVGVLARYGQCQAQASRQVWAPGICLETQEDIAALLSPAHYRQLILPYDRRLWGLAPYLFRHLHSTGLQTLEALISEPQLRAIEITLDVVSPPIPVLQERVRQVQAGGKPVILHGTLNPADMAALASGLDPCGLYIAARVHTVEEAHEFVEAVQRELGGGKGGG